MLALLVLAALLPSQRAAAAEHGVLALPSNVLEVPAKGHLEALYDPTGALSFEEVRAQGGRFAALPGNFNASYVPKGAWWVRLRLAPEPGANGQWWLVITAPYTDHIAVYAPDQDADGTLMRNRHKESGAMVPARERDLFTFTNVVRLQVPAGETSEIYLRLSGNRALNAQLTLWRLPELARHLTLSVLTFSLGVGAAIITSIGTLVMAAWLRAPQFGWYGAYVGAVSLVFLGNGGFGQVLLSSWDPGDVIRLQNMVGCFSVLAGAFMVRGLFRTREGARIIDALLKALGLFSALCVVASAFGYYKVVAPYLMLGILGLALVSPWLALQQVRHREPAGLWYFVGFTSYCAATIWFSLVVLGVAPLTDFLGWGYQTAGFLHMAAIFAGLASSMRAGSRARRRLESQLLALSRSNERQLEFAVAERTAALNEEVEGRRRAEDALQRALKEQRNFLVMVSHEFRTPLSTMRLAVTVMERGLGTGMSALRREVDKVGRAVTRLSNLIDTFLADEWLEHSAMMLQHRPVDMGALVADVVHDQGSQAPGRVFLGPCPQTVIEGDAVLLRTVLDNLVGNALKHTDGPVTASLAPADDGVLIEVADRGRGVPEAEREEIFERYYRSPSTVTRPGTGIGLYLARLIVEQHAGWIKVGDRSEGGSVFKVWLPRQPGLDRPTAREG
ncbi:sensor histidine kinase [Aquabacter sp. L1I39]|uniref:sensor histidine kinase n=1 Tax=Aquabacter sp. L1I39 TaxID=2820278 RepID=UPI001AD96AC2|nr:sensor histidine kinase [Aquabacter sp. L1I39]QTL03293.1 sensor histidine kinase [Aquabacter sp. L1I39]